MYAEVAVPQIRTLLGSESEAAVGGDGADQLGDIGEDGDLQAGAEAREGDARDGLEVYGRDLEACVGADADDGFDDDFFGVEGDWEELKVSAIATKLGVSGHPSRMSELE